MPAADDRMFPGLHPAAEASDEVPIAGNDEERTARRVVERNRDAFGRFWKRQGAENRAEQPGVAVESEGQFDFGSGEPIEPTEEVFGVLVHRSSPTPARLFWPNFDHGVPLHPWRWEMTRGCCRTGSPLPMTR